MNTELKENLEQLGIASSETVYEALKTERKSLLQQVKDTRNALKDIEDVIQAERNQTIDLLVTANAAISTAALWEQNEQLLNEFYLDYYAKEIYEVPAAEKSIVEGIANQCTEEGGRAVSRARRYARLWDFIAITDCDGAENRSIFSTADAEEISVFPVPAAEILNIQSEHPIHEIQLLDVSGQLVLEKRIEHKIAAVNTEGLSNGFYTLVLTFDNGQTSIQKVIVHQ